MNLSTFWPTSKHHQVGVVQLPAVSQKGCFKIRLKKMGSKNRLHLFQHMFWGMSKHVKTSLLHQLRKHEKNTKKWAVFWAKSQKPGASLFFCLLQEHLPTSLHQTAEFLLHLVMFPAVLREVWNVMLWGFLHTTTFGRWNSIMMNITQKLTHTVDGGNPAPVDMEKLPFFAGFYTSQVVQDFFHQQYEAVQLFAN